MANRKEGSHGDTSTLLHADETNAGTNHPLIFPEPLRGIPVASHPFPNGEEVNMEIGLLFLVAFISGVVWFSIPKGIREVIIFGLAIAYIVFFTQQ
jgi:hypothetical protein